MTDSDEAGSKSKDPGLQPKYEKFELMELMDDVRRLARYAVETANLPDSVDIGSLYEVQRKFRDEGALDSEGFRILVDAYQEMERRLGPVTAETLKATELSEGWQQASASSSHAAGYVRKLRLRTYVNVALILIAHVIHLASGVEHPSQRGTQTETIAQQIMQDETAAADNNNTANGAQRNREVSTAEASARNDSLRIALLALEWKSGLTLLGLIALYLLPFFYGALGADAYILRTTTQELRERRFDPRRIPQNDSRLLVGALSGGVVIFFVTSDFFPVVNSPFDLRYAPIGFIAGYSTDFLFSTVERVINAILPRNPNQSTSGDARSRKDGF